MTEICGKRIVITGGAGFVGSHIADQLIPLEPAMIIILDNFIRGRHENINWAIENGPVTIVDADIRDAATLAKIMTGVDVVFHQAAIRITQCEEEPRLAFDVLVDGTFNVLEAAAYSGVKRIVAASSASVYGMAERFPTDEQHHPYNNRTIYGGAKLFNESMLRFFYDTYGLDYAALRYFNVYGPRMDTCGPYTEVLIRWMERIARGEPPLIFGDGSQTMDFVHVADVARANVLAACADVTNQVYNVATGRETSLLRLAQALCEAMDTDIAPVFEPERKSNPVPRRLADTSRAVADLGYVATIDLTEGLRGLVDWWRGLLTRPGTQQLGTERTAAQGERQ